MPQALVVSSKSPATTDNWRTLVGGAGGRSSGGHTDGWQGLTACRSSAVMQRCLAAELESEL